MPGKKKFKKLLVSDGLGGFRIGGIGVPHGRRTLMISGLGRGIRGRKRVPYNHTAAEIPAQHDDDDDDDLSLSPSTLNGTSIQSQDGEKDERVMEIDSTGDDNLEMAMDLEKGFGMGFSGGSRNSSPPLARVSDHCNNPGLSKPVEKQGNRSGDSESRSSCSQSSCWESDSDYSSSESDLEAQSEVDLETSDSEADEESDENKTKQGDSSPDRMDEEGQMQAINATQSEYSESGLNSDGKLEDVRLDMEDAAFEETEWEDLPNDDPTFFSPDDETLEWIEGRRDPISDDGTEKVDGSNLKYRDRLGFLVWTMRFMISTRAYSELVKLLKVPGFSVASLPEKRETLHQLRNRLPLARLQSHKVPLDSNQLPSGEKARGTGLAYTYDVESQIRRVLMDKEVIERCHFGLGVEAWPKSEVYHGQLWHESVLAAKDAYPIFLENRDSIFPSCFVSFTHLDHSHALKGWITGIMHDENKQLVARIRLLASLPSPASTPRAIRLRCAVRNGDPNPHEPHKLERLFLELQELVVPLKNILKRLNGFIWRGSRPCRSLKNFDFIVDYILIRDPQNFSSREFIPCRHLEKLETELELEANEITMEGLEQPRQQSEDTLPTITWVLSPYLDKFGVFRTTHRSIGGWYCQLYNESFSDRMELRNRIVLGFVPFGAKFKDTAKHTFPQLRRLSRNGFVAPYRGCRCRHLVKLHNKRMDMVEANESSGTKNQRANHPCRQCDTDKSELLTLSSDISPSHRILALRRPWEMERIRNNARNAPTKEKQDLILREHGLLAESAPLSTAGFGFDVHRQCPIDIAHLKGGIMNDLIELTFDFVLNGAGAAGFTTEWNNFIFPSHWPSIPNPVTHKASYTISNALRIVAVGPSIFRRYLSGRHILPTTTAKIQRAYPEEVDSADECAEHLIKTWAFAALGNWWDFASEVSEGHYEQMEKCANDAQLMMYIQFLPLIDSGSKNKRKDFSRRPNYHQHVHTKRNAIDFATNINTAVIIDESIHRVWKGLVPHTNHWDMDKVFCQFDNEMQAIRTTLSLDSHPLSGPLHRLRCEVPTLFSGHYFGHRIPSSTNDHSGRINKLVIAPIDDRFFDINLASRFLDRDAQSVGWTTSLWRKAGSVHPDRSLEEALRSNLSSFYNQLLPIFFDRKSGKLRWWKKLTYYDALLNQRIGIQVGSFLGINIDSSSAKSDVSYVRVTGILSINLHNQDFIFFLVEWLRTPDSSAVPPPAFCDGITLAVVQHIECSPSERIIALPAVASIRSPCLHPVPGDPIGIGQRFWVIHWADISTC